MPCIRGNLLHDFQSLNKIELSVYDYWDDLSAKSDSALTIEDKALLDRIAELTLQPDERRAELHSLFESLPRTQRIYGRLRLLGILESEQAAEPHELLPSGMQRLEEIIASESIRTPPADARLTSSGAICQSVSAR